MYRYMISALLFFNAGYACGSFKYKRELHKIKDNYNKINNK